MRTVSCRRRLLLSHWLFGSCRSGCHVLLVILALDRVEAFLAMNGDLLRSIDSQSDLVATDINDRDLDIVRDNDALVALSRQNKHR